MRDSVKVIEETEKEFAKRFGRKYGFTEDYRCEDADVIVVAMGTLGKEAEVAIDLLRKEGIKAGSMRIRWLRPFPKLDLKGKQVVVIDRDYSFGRGGILATEIMAQTKEEVCKRHRRYRRAGSHLRGYRGLCPEPSYGNRVLVRGEQQCLRSASTPGAGRAALPQPGSLPLPQSMTGNMQPQPRSTVPSAAGHRSSRSSASMTSRSRSTARSRSRTWSLCSTQA